MTISWICMAIKIDLLINYTLNGQGNTGVFSFETRSWNSKLLRRIAFHFTIFKNEIYDLFGKWTIHRGFMAENSEASRLKLDDSQIDFRMLSSCREEYWLAEADKMWLHLPPLQFKDQSHWNSSPKEKPEWRSIHDPRNCFILSSRISFPSFLSVRTNYGIWLALA